MNPKLRAIAFAVWLSLCAFSFWILWTPIPFLELKIALLGSIVCIFVGAFCLFNRHRRSLAIGAALCILTFLLIAFWPPSAYSKERLRGAYVDCLRSYLGTKYVWGGENRRGIDCSGLVRRAMIDALIKTGLEEKNPYLWRSACQIWWNDCAARDMKDSSDWRFQAEFATSNLNGLDDSRLSLGDLAVTKNGIHVLAFVGERTWIQADPNLVNGGDKVILTIAPSKNGWFGQDMVICRWSILS